MKSNIIYHKYSQQYAQLLNQFFKYIITHKVDFLDILPKESNIVIFDEKNPDLSSYSNLVLKNLLKKNTQNILEVRKTDQRGLPWKVSTPLNFISPA